MKVKVQTWGNSLGLRVPKAIDLNALLAEITAENRHAECDWGAASGVEAWWKPRWQQSDDGLSPVLG